MEINNGMKKIPRNSQKNCLIELIGFLKRNVKTSLMCM